MLNYFFITEDKESYDSLTCEDKEKVRTIVYIMDRFSISQQAYHELAQLEPSLPRRHLVEGHAKKMDSNWDIKRTPGKCSGAELPFKLLLEKEILILVSNKTCNPYEYAIHFNHNFIINFYLGTVLLHYELN